MARLVVARNISIRFDQNMIFSASFFLLPKLKWTLLGNALKMPTKTKNQKKEKKKENYKKLRHIYECSCSIVVLPYCRKPCTLSLMFFFFCVNVIKVYGFENNNWLMESYSNGRHKSTKASSINYKLYHQFILYKFITGCTHITIEFYYTLYTNDGFYVVHITNFICYISIHRFAVWCAVVYCINVYIKLCRC